MWRSTFILAGLFFACGTAPKPDMDGPTQNPDQAYTAKDFELRPELTRSELTTEVDERRYRSAAPPSASFSAAEPVIYLVGKLKRVPTGAAIEVRWFIDVHPEPVLVSEVRGSSTFQFIASFQPEEQKFDRGTHTARVYVNDTEIASVPFEIFDKEIEQKGARVLGVQFSKKVNRKKRPKKAATRFQIGTPQIYVSFGVKRTDRGSNAEITWLRDGTLFHNQDITLSGNRRYAAHIASPEGLPTGEYEVQISIHGERLSTKSFLVGEPSTGPTVEQVTLGTEIDANQVPINPTTTFTRDGSIIHCGIRFLQLNPNSSVEIQWIHLDKEDEILRYNNRIELPDGGEGIMGAAWEPDYGFEAGAYKLVVLINDEPKAEQLFEVE